MQLYHVLRAEGSTTTVRHLNFSDFRETTFSEKSFLTPELQLLLRPGGYFLVRHGDKYKVAEVIEAAPDHEQVQDYQDLMAALHEQLELKPGRDPISHLKQRAETLKFIKGNQNDFFKSKVGVFTWLVRKTLLARADKDQPAPL